MKASTEEWEMSESSSTDSVVVDRDRSNRLPRCILFSDVYQKIHKVWTWCDGNKQITRLERVKYFVDHHTCAHQAEQ
jgi:hypothetical protein